MRPLRTTAALVAAAALAAGLVAGCSPAERPPAPAGSDADAAGANWPQFRGPAGLGIVAADDAYPTDWDAPTGRGILWKVDVPATGHSSPIVWGERILLTGESGGQGHVLCFAAADGAKIWDVSVASATPGEADFSSGGGLCAPTPATDGRRVYALFATGDMTCVDFSGKVVWRKRLVEKPVNAFGLCSSPVLWKDTVIVQLDQGNSGDEGLSAVLALDKATGTVRWSTQRPVPNSWSTPIIIRHESRPELITCANPFVIAYDPDTGRELWRVKGLDCDVVPMPTYGAGLVFAANAGARLLAIRPGGSGDVTGTRVAWSADEGLPTMVSPLTDGRKLLLCEAGDLTCYDVATGEVAWRATAGEGSWASPALVGANVYLPDMSGKMLIFALDGTSLLKDGADVHDEITATPAFAAGRIYLRTKRGLFAVGRR